MVCAQHACRRNACGLATTAQHLRIAFAALRKRQRHAIFFNAAWRQLARRRPGGAGGGGRAATQDLDHPPTLSQNKVPLHLPPPASATSLPLPGTHGWVACLLLNLHRPRTSHPAACGPILKTQAGHSTLDQCLPHSPVPTSHLWWHAFPWDLTWADGQYMFGSHWFLYR